MKVLKLVAVFALVTGLFCGGEEQAEQPVERTDPVAMGAMPAVAFELITDEEMAALTEALPDVVAVLQAENYAPEEREGEEIPDILARVVTGMGEVAGVEAVLQKHDIGWADFSQTMFKVMAASAAIGLDMAVAMAEQMVDATEEGQEMKKELERVRAFCDMVPQENRDIIIENMDKLEVLNEIN